MKISMNLILFVGALLLTQSSWSADSLKKFGRDVLDIDLKTNYYLSSGNYEQNSGGYTALPYGGKYTLMDVSLQSRLTLSRWAFSLGTNMSMAESKGYNTTDGYYTKNNSNLNKITGGVEYLMYDDWLQIIPEVNIVIPLDSYNMTSGREVMTDEGAIETTAQATLQKDFGSLKGFTYLGINYRTEGRSTLMPWGLGAEFKFWNMAAGAQISGFSSIADDKDASYDVLRRQHSRDINGGSYYYGAVNPMSVEYLLWYRFRIGPVMTKLYAGANLNGGNYSAGTQFGVLLRYSFDWGPSAGKGPKRNFDPNQRNDDLNLDDPRTFQEDTHDGVDQKMFHLNHSSGSSSQPSNSTGMNSSDPAPANPSVQMKKSQTQDDYQPETSSSDVDYQIKLKPAKKVRKK